MMTSMQYYKYYWQENREYTNDEYNCDTKDPQYISYMMSNKTGHTYEANKPTESQSNIRITNTYIMKKFKKENFNILSCSKNTRQTDDSAYMGTSWYQKHCKRQAQ